jgi:hypothetical protein
MGENQGLLEAVINQYCSSDDFNGFYVSKADGEILGAAIDLTRSGLIQVVSEDDYVNPHIRPWPSKRSIDDQIESIEKLQASEYGLCLYPTPEVLSERPCADSYPDQPYRQAMADGRGTLELAFFGFDVLEPYRNDPRFTFSFYDFGGKTVIGDAAYEDQQEPDHDKIMLGNFGFAYDLSGYDPQDPESPLVRRVCAFFGDLAKLSSIHQQRWKTYEVGEELHPHPMWWGQMMGHWADGLGPFDRFTFELEALNALTVAAIGEPLFRSTERPREFGWILRPSQQEWDAFILLLDKLLSENIRPEALNAADAPKKNDNGDTLGTVNRLGALMELRGIDDDTVKTVLAPIREVRDARMRPAHTLRANINDRTFVHQQVALLERVNRGLQQLRWWWQSHPANAEWQEPTYAGDDAPQYRM